MAGVFDFLHIKHRTAGSSNELSFDVLDAARHQLESQKKQERSRGTRGLYGGSPGRRGGTPTLLAGNTEVVRRKRERRNHSLRLKIVACLVALAVLCTGVLVSHQLYMARMDFSGRLNGLVAEFSPVDASLVTADSLMGSLLDTALVDQQASALEGLEGASDGMDAILRRAQAMREDFSGEFEVMTLGEVEDAVAARRDLLAAARSALELATDVQSQAAVADDAWEKVVAAAETSQEAAELANEAASEDELTQVDYKTQLAIADLSEADQALSELEGEIKGLDFSAQHEYIALRIAGLQSALATTQAILDGDREAASEANAEYNAKEREAAAAAAELPASLGDVVREHYVSQVEQAKEVYDEARAVVTVSDANLRQHL